jgi:hypothetical protein
MEQLERALVEFELQFPGKQALIFVDNSSNHEARSESALNERAINSGDKMARKKGAPGSAPSVDSQYKDASGNLRKQEMNWIDENNVVRRKGMKRILVERGRILEGSKLGAECNKCRAEKKRGNPDRYKIQEQRTKCCLRRMLSLEDDFANQKSQLEEVVVITLVLFLFFHSIFLRTVNFFQLAEEMGHILVFLPKFHCELNFIEMYWGKAKRIMRTKFEEEGLDFNVANLTKYIPMCFDEAAEDTDFLKRVANKSFRYMDAYEQGATGPLAEFANKKYAGHRCIPENWLSKALKVEFSNKYKQTTEECWIDWDAKNLQPKKDEEKDVVMKGKDEKTSRPSRNARKRKRAASFKVLEPVRTEVLLPTKRLRKPSRRQLERDSSCDAGPSCDGESSCDGEFSR